MDRATSFCFVLLLLLLISTIALRAQEIPGSATFAADFLEMDTLAAAGRRDGRAAAGKQDTGPRFVLAVAGGLPVGFFGLPALSDQDPIQVVSAGVGLILMGGAAVAGGAAPPAGLADSAAARGIVYERAFREGYAERLRARRRSAALWGGLTGTTAGFGLLAFLLSQITT